MPHEAVPAGALLQAEPTCLLITESLEFSQCIACSTLMLACSSIVTLIHVHVPVALSCY